MFGEICVPSGLEVYLIYSDISILISPILMWLRVFLEKSVGKLEEVCVFEVKWPKANFTASNPILELVSYLQWSRDQL